MRTLRLTRLATVSVLGILALALNSAISYQAIQTVHNNENLVQQSYLLQKNIRSLLSPIKDAETGQRGFLVTGDESYLRPFVDAHQQALQQIQTLENFSGISADQLARVEKLKELTESKFRELDRTIELRRKAGFEASRAVVMQGEGRSLMDEIRKTISELYDAEQAKLNQRAADSRSSYMRSLIALVTANLIALMLVIYVEVSHIRRRRLQEFLNLSEERYRLAFDDNPQPMWVFDARTLRFLSVNAATLRQYGYTKEEFLGLTIKDIRPQEEVPRLMALMERPSPPFRMAGVWKHRKKDGGLLDAEITSGDIVWDGVPAKLVVAPDVSDRLWAERHLVEWKQRHEAAINASGQILFDWDPVTNEMTFSNHLERLGYNTLEMEGGLSHWRELVHPDDQHAFDREIERVLESRGNFSLRYRVRKKDDNYIHVEGTGRFVVDKDNKVVRMVGFVTDVTDRALLQVQLLQAQKMEAVGRLAGGVAHDFNNMLGVIMGCGELLGQDQTVSDKSKQWLTAINDAGARAATLTRQLLAFSRQQVLQPRVISFNIVIREMESILRRVTGEDVELRTFLHPELDNVKVDPAQIEQVIMNLAVNARDAMPDGGKLTVETTNIELDEDYCRQHSSVTPGRYVLLAVSDTGIGMDSQTMSRIFEPFFTTKPREKGTGLGLATVYGIVKQSGGHIWLYSEPNHGATFKLYFPCTHEPVSHANQPRKALETPGGTETILLAEDEDLYRDLIRDSLTTKGYNVLVASDGNKALALANAYQDRIALLVTDAVMPGMNGKKLAEALAGRRPEMKVLYMSGYTTNVVVHHGVLDPGTNFIAKPFAPSTLFRKVREVLDAVTKT